jgi:hypothetical protein
MAIVEVPYRLVFNTQTRSFDREVSAIPMHSLDDTVVEVCKVIEYAGRTFVEHPGHTGYILREHGGMFVALDRGRRYYDRDVLKALRFARREDAEAYKGHMPWDIVPVGQAI